MKQRLCGRSCGATGQPIDAVCDVGLVVELFENGGWHVT